MSPSRPATPKIRAAGPKDHDEMRTLFREYAQAILAPQCFQGFEEEVRALPGDYTPPQGRFLIAFIGYRPAGCVCLRFVSEDTCEMKRLFVRPAFRGRGVGRALAKQAIVEAQVAGYRRMVLDTLPTMKEARGLYRTLGFEAAKPYWEHPVPDAIFLQKTLNC